MTSPEPTYPVEEGNIYRLTGDQTRYNRLVQARCDHIVFVWLLYVHRVLKYQQPKERAVTIITYMRPTMPGMEGKCVVRRSTVQLETLTLYLRRGYNLVCNYRYTKNRSSIKRFYKLIGELR